MMPTDCRTEQKDIDSIRDRMLEERTVDDLSGFFRIFGDSTRVRLLWALDTAGRMCVCGLSKSLDMSMSAVSHQLRILKDANLIKGERDGKYVYYSLCDEHVRIVLEMALEHVQEGKG
ncbi:MAG: metalloregulator ArsR/SmtB family transcription factor [Gudongella sp.]|nr:metalloregulator ArsR/SmtB family transcription factor [Gudongella sp.]